MSSWSSNLYENNALKENCNPDYLHDLIKYGRKLQSKGMPVIFTLAHLSLSSSSPYIFNQKIIQRRIDPYKQFNIKKHSGGYRQIVIPEYHLMNTQRWINQNILSKGKVHPCAYAYVKGRNIKQNAEVHCGAKWLIKMDIHRFFESITERQIYKIFEGFGYTKLFSFELTRLCTRTTTNSRKKKSKRWKAKQEKYKFYKNEHIGHLPQGAPTSPALSNLFFYNIDEKLVEIAALYNCTYTRYSDDLTFSTNDFSRERAKQFISKVSYLLSMNGFKHNHKKTKVIPPGAQKNVTGLVVNEDTPKVKKEQKDKIENHLYFSQKYGLYSHCERKKFKSIIGFKNHLEGLIRYVESIDEKLGKKYYSEFKKINWPEL